MNSRNRAQLWRDASGTRAFIVEGGGMRGAFSLGGLLAFEASGWELPEAIFASSSGALNAAWLLSDDVFGAVRTYVRILTNGNIIRPSRFWNMLDIDALIEQLRREHPRRLDRLAVRERTRLFVALTDAQTGEALHLDLGGHSDPWSVLKATAALPGAVRGPVIVDGRPYADGGPFAVPTDQMRSAGVRLAVAFLTRPRGFTRSSPSVGSRLLSRFFYRGLSSAAHRRFLDYSTAYNRGREEIFSGIDAHMSWIVVAPPDGASLPKRLERDPGKVISAIRLGLDTGMEEFAGPRSAWSVDQIAHYDALQERIERILQPDGQAGGV